MSWTLRRIGFMSDEELEAEKKRHRDDGEGWCAATCKTGMFLHWHAPCTRRSHESRTAGATEARSAPELFVNYDLGEDIVLWYHALTKQQPAVSAWERPSGRTLRR
jgi:hypothetical protein